MARERDLKLDSYGISKMRYRELKYFCLQYPEKKRQVSSLAGLNAMMYDDMPKGGQLSDPTVQGAARIESIMDDIRVIDETAAEAAPGMTQALIKNVTENIPYEYMPVPAGKRQFFEARRKFFYLLSQKR